MKTPKTKTCCCETCGKYFHYLGIARHRAMHRDRREDCVIEYTHGERFLYKYSEIKEIENEPKN